MLCIILQLTHFTVKELIMYSVHKNIYKNYLLKIFRPLKAKEKNINFRILIAENNR